jgi:cytochrome c-type biogenesis protein CcmE
MSSKSSGWKVDRVTRKQRRLMMIGGCGVVLAAAVVMMLYAIGDSKVFFQNPTDLVAKNIPAGTRIRIGGLVKEGSVQRGSDLQVRFEVTDGKTSIPVRYQGILPDLFREGQGVVAEGKLEPDKVVDADTVLAKHDERYMPKEVADALKKSGRWNEGEGAAKGAAVAGATAR